MVTKRKYQILEERKVSKKKNIKKGKEEPKGNVLRKSKVSMLKQQLRR